MTICWTSCPACMCSWLVSNTTRPCDLHGDGKPQQSTHTHTIACQTHYMDVTCAVSQNNLFLLHYNWILPRIQITVDIVHQLIFSINICTVNQMCCITFSTSDCDILSPAMANIKWLENILQAQVHLSFCACFDQISSWEPGLWVTVSQPEDTLKC